MGVTELSKLRDRVAIVGVGTTPQGTIPGKDGNEIAVDAFKLALDDAGLEKEDIDGLLTCRSFGGLGVDTQIAPMLGLNPLYSATLDYGTCNFSLHFAAMLVAGGFAHTVACVYGTNQRSNRNRFAGGAAADYTAAHGLFNIAGPASMALRRHMHEYGTTEEQMSAIAVTEREHATLNPIAVMRDRPMTRDDYLNSRYIVAPLHLYDMCLITDGGSCLIVTSAERARDMKQPAVYVMGMAENTSPPGLPERRPADATVHQDCRGPDLSGRGDQSRRCRRAVHPRSDERLGAADAGVVRVLRNGRGGRLHPGRAYRPEGGAPPQHQRGAALGELHVGLAAHPGGGTPASRPGGPAAGGGGRNRPVLLDHGIQQGGLNDHEEVAG